MATAGDKEALPHLTEFLKDLYHCSDCGYCVEAIWEERGVEHICATLGSHSPALSYSGQGYLKLARAWVEGESLPLPELAERVFSCTGCGNCERICPIGLRPMHINRALRRELDDRGVAPGSAIAVREGMAAQQNPAAAPFAERYGWTSALDAGEDGEALYLPGCAAAHGRPAEARAAVALLNAAGVGVQLLGDADRCCGAPLRELGMAEDARRQGALLEERLAERGYGFLLTSGCECANTFAGVDRHRSFVAWLAEALREGALRPTARGGLPRVACLESCQATLAARAGAGDDNQGLRDLLAALGVEVIGDAASPYRLCCGAAGGMVAMQPESSLAMARARIREISGAQALISADPRCVARFETAREAGDPPVYGVAEFIAQHFAFGGQEP